jgi:mannosyltransferase
MSILTNSEMETHLVPTPSSDERVERWARYAICLLVLYAITRAVVASISKPFWYDEIFTLVLARQPNLATIWSALHRGVDSQPPLFDLIERVGTVVPNAEIGFRIPSVIGFACVLVCLFVFVQRRSGGVYGLISAGIVMLTTLYSYYAIEARPYSLVAACVAVALVAYQRAPSLLWIGLMAFALAIAESLHYYAIFAFVPFGMAEAFLSWQTSRIRWSVWIALIVGASPLAIFWPLLARFRAINGQNFWARPTVVVLRDVYGHFLQMSFFWGLAVAIVCGLAVLGVFWSFRNGPGEEFADKFFHERVLVLFLVATPLTVLVACKLVHGGYTERYVLYSVLGISLATGLVLPRLGRPTLIVFSSLLLCAIGLQEVSFWFSPRKPPWRLQSPVAVAERMLSSADHPDLPLVVTDGNQYLTLAHYASEPFGARLVSVVDAPTAVRYANTDSYDKALPILANYLPLKVYDFQDFRSTHPSFLLYVNAGEWWTDRLVHDGYGLHLVASDADHMMFLVTRPEDARP